MGSSTSNPQDWTVKNDKLKVISSPKVESLKVDGKKPWGTRLEVGRLGGWDEILLFFDLNMEEDKIIGRKLKVLILEVRRVILNF